MARDKDFEALREELERHAYLLEPIDRSLVYVGKNGRVAWASQRLSSLGIHPIEAVGKHAEKVLSKEAAALIARSLEGKKAARELVIGGNKVELRSAPFEDEGVIRGAVVALANLSPLEKARNELAAKAKELKRLNLRLGAENRLQRVSQDISKAIATGESTEEILHILVESIRRVFKGTGAIVFERRRGGALYPASYSGLSSRASELVLDPNYEKSLSGQVALAGKAKAFNDPAEVKSMLQHKWFQEYGKRVLGAPIQVGNELHGVLLHVGDHKYSEEDANAMQYLSDIAAIVLRNAKQASIDGLTGLLNRQKFDAAYDQEVSRARSLRQPLTAVFADIDHLKKANDQYGHAFGDKLVRNFALVHNRAQERLLQHLKNTRFKDARPAVGRYGGDEIVTVASMGMDDADKYKQFLREEEARARKEGLFTPPGEVAPFKTKLTIGIASSETPGVDPGEVLRIADDVMYGYKQRRGREKAFRDWWKERPKLLRRLLPPAIRQKIEDRAIARETRRAALRR